MKKYLLDKEIENYQNQGAILIKNIFSSWIDLLIEGFEKVLKEPGPHARENVKNEDLPPIVDPKHVRLKHSKSFFLQKNNINVWRIDLSKCWSSSSRTNVEEKQHTENPIYEVECELVDTNVYLKSNDNSHILKSIIMKGLGLAGTPTLDYKLCK